MARRAEAEPVYRAASTWMQRSLQEERSIFLPAPLLWRLENLEVLRTALASKRQPGTGDFEATFQRQIIGLPAEVIQLAAEMLWLLFLFPRKLLSAERKRQLVMNVWNWSERSFYDIGHYYLSDEVLAGIGSAGTAFNTQRDRELAALLDIVIALKRDSEGRWYDAPWKVASLIDGIPTAATRNIRNILLHLLFPDQFERVTSFARKQTIVRTYSSLLGDYRPFSLGKASEIDRQLLHIRKKLETRSPGEEIDFYDAELRAVWDRPRPGAPTGPTVGAPGEYTGPELNDFAWSGVSFAYRLASMAAPPRAEPDSVLLFAAYLMLTPLRKHYSISGRALYELLTTTRRSKDLYFLLAEYDFGSIPAPPSELPRVPVGPAVAEVLAAAEEVRRAVSTVQGTVSARHVLAALLKPEAGYPVQDTLRAHGYDLREVRAALFRSVQTYSSLEVLESWRLLLNVEGEAFPATDATTYAGFSADSLAADARRGVTRADDRLGVMRDVTALCEVLAAHQTRPPLAVGLFGDWGTGKSFFMELMRKEIEELGERNPSFYCSRVVQVWFNAWHYMDTNLWASLAARVFEELADQVERWAGSEDVRRQLFAKLEDSRGVLAQAVEERKDAEARIKEIQVQRIRREQSLAATSTTAFRAAVAALSADQEVQEKLRDAKERLGLSDAQVQVEQAGAQARELKSLGRHLLAVGRVLFHEPRFLLFGVLIFAAVTGSALWAIQQFELFAGPARWFARAAAWLAGLGLAVAPAARQVARAVAWLEDVGTRLRQQRDAEQRQEEIAIQRDLNRLEERERDAQARVDSLSRDIEEMRAGRRLQRFILERHASAEYRQHLGLVNLIRNDFEQLSRLLSESAEETGRAPESPAVPDAPPLPRIDRIVLYIDDLDRCPEDRVVEVLQAVHLLLAFPLFVVVVGVDSRWLLLSLEDHYATLRGHGGERRANGPVEKAGWRTTPQNYLEKIFQIPFTLRPMEVAGFESLVEALLPVSDGGRGPDSAEQTVESEFPAGPEAEEEVDGDDVAPGSGEKLETGLPESVPLVPPNPQGLTVDAAEREFIVKLHPLIASPRALKRFTNVYRLLRVQQRGADLDRFRGTERRPGEFQVAGLLLAALVGYPAEATRLLHRVLAARDEPWWMLVDALDEARTEEKDASEGKPRSQPDARRGRPSLREALLEVRRTVSLQDHPRETYVRWTREVARFSFQAGRILSVRDSHEETATAAPGDTVQSAE